jgi:hypothetical protein
VDESQPAPSRVHARGRNTGLKVALAVLVVVVAVSAIILCWPRSDRELSKACIGTWRAVDPTNAALHMEEAEVASETVVIRPDGNLEYTVKPASPTETDRTETWGWKIEHGHLRLQFRGSGNAEPWLAPLEMSVDGTALRIHRAEYPVKEFERVVR